MAEKNQYFPHLFEPLKVGSKTIKNRIEAAPALFAYGTHAPEPVWYSQTDPDPVRYNARMQIKPALPQYGS